MVDFRVGFRRWSGTVAFIYLFFGAQLLAIGFDRSLESLFVIAVVTRDFHYRLSRFVVGDQLPHYLLQAGTMLLGIAVGNTRHFRLCFLHLALCANEDCCCLNTLPESE